MKFDSTNNFGIFLLRHGKTKLNTDGMSPDLIRGWKDVPLDKSGVREGRLVAEMMIRSGLKFSKIYSSDLQRSLNTAKPVAKKYGLPIISEHALRPWHLQDLEGKATALEAIQHIRHGINNPDEPIAGGESFHEFSKRFLTLFKSIMEEYEATGKNILVVCHYRNLKLIQAWLEAYCKGIDEQTFFRHDSPPSSIIRIYPQPSGWGWQLVSHGPREYLVRESLANDVVDTGQIDRSDPEGLYSKSIDPNDLAAFRAYIGQHGGEISDGELVQALEGAMTGEEGGGEQTFGGLILKLDAMGHRYLYDPVSGQAYQGDQPDPYEDIQQGPQDNVKSNNPNQSRGQPENAGQFGPGGGGKKPKDKADKASKQPEQESGQQTQQPAQSGQQSGERPLEKRGPQKNPNALVFTEPNVADIVREGFQEIFPNLDPSQAHQLVGLPDGVPINVTGWMGKNSGTTGISIGHRIDGGGGIQRMLRTFEKNSNEVVCHNESFFINPEKRGSGLGTDIFRNQVQECANNGVSKIETFATRSDDTDPSQAANGYYVWPKLGYDGYLPQKIQQALPPELSGATGGAATIESADAHLRAGGKVTLKVPYNGSEKTVKIARVKNGNLIDTEGGTWKAATVQQGGKRIELVGGSQQGAANTIQELYAKPGGEEWWKQNGESIALEFDLRPSSKSIEKLNAYLTAHGKPAIEAPKPEPKPAEVARPEVSATSRLDSRLDRAVSRVRQGKSLAEAAWGVVVEDTLPAEYAKAVWNNAELHRHTDGIPWMVAVFDAIRHETKDHYNEYVHKIGIGLMELASAINNDLDQQWNS